MFSNPVIGFVQNFSQHPHGYVYGLFCTELALDVLYHTMPHMPCRFEVRYCIACGALFRHILKEVRVCFSSFVCNKKNFLHMDVQIRIQPVSVQPLHEGVLEFELGV